MWTSLDYNLGRQVTEEMQPGKREALLQLGECMGNFQNPGEKAVDALTSLIAEISGSGSTAPIATDEEPQDAAGDEAPRPPNGSPSIMTTRVTNEFRPHCPIIPATELGRNGPVPETQALADVFRRPL